MTERIVCFRCGQDGHRSGQCPWPAETAAGHADQRRKRNDGVQTLADLRNRCRIDDETGCWEWAMAAISPRGSIVPIVHLGRGALGADPSVKQNNMPAARAAWLMAGNLLPAGHIVWRHVCAAGLCINPGHCRAGTRSQMHAAVAATGRNKGKPDRRAINARNRLGMVTAVEVVRKAEAMFADGVLQRDVRKALGMAQETAARIRKGQHVHSAGKQMLVRGASVFCWVGGA